MKRSGFTLLELLVVIVVIGILATIVASSASSAMRASRTKRKDISCQILETAINRYRTEYGEWPGGKSGNATSKTFAGTANADVFGMLRASSSENIDKIRFLDETAFFTPGGNDEAEKLSETTGSKPLVCQYKSGRWTNKDGNYLYFTVVIDYDDETVSVTAPGFDDDKEVEGYD